MKNHKVTCSALVTLLASSVLLTACDLSPDFDVPETKLPERYKANTHEVAPEYWQEAVPYENVKRGEWWKIFDDEVLNLLQKQAAENSPNLQIAAERVTQARANIGSAFAALMPNIDALFSPSREKFSAGSPNLPPGQTTKPQTSYNAQGLLSYEVDLFGRITGNYRIAELNADAAESQYEVALLSLQADIAQLYFNIRGLDAQRDLLERTVKLRDDNLRIASRLHELGETSAIDKARAESEFATTKAELLALTRQRDEAENALALLIGAMPSDYTLPATPLSDRNPPAIPAGVPSGLLARRPDVSAAIRQMEAANRKIGVARAAMFPRIVLTAAGGYQSGAFGDLFDWSNRAWSLGPGAAAVVTQPIFEGGRVFYEIDRFKSQKAEAIVSYRAQVLTAFAEVEDSLNAIALLTQEGTQQRDASEAAAKAQRMSDLLYKEGDISYLESLEAQRTALTAQRGFITAQTQRWVATVNLIRALGGSWEQKLPGMEKPTLDKPAPETTLTPLLTPTQGTQDETTQNMQNSAENGTTGNSITDVNK